MAPSPVSPPQPERTPEGIYHPMPDLQSLQGAYISNIERLEDRAERMSESGSDLGEEIRRLQLEQKLSDSRRSSLLPGGDPGEDAAKPFDTRSRGASVSSYANSIVDVNSAARWGGYSPGGFITSPGGSLRSGSASQQAPHQRQRSASRTSRLGQVVHAEEEQDETAYMAGAEYASSQSHRSGLGSAPQRHRSTSSFTRRYDQIAQEIHDELSQPGQQDHPGMNTQYRFDDGQPETPRIASTDTANQTPFMWQDFDGTHCPEGSTTVGANASREPSLMKLAPPMPPVAPPEDGMVFYPAPVPQMLNLPKRLSKAPANNVQARRRTQLLESMNADNRKSAPWLSEELANTDARKSRQSLANLPPQLRASAFFDQAGPPQEFAVKGESAEATLDSILEASASAPPSAFTDHLFAGHVGDEVYGRQRNRVSKAVMELDKADARKSRSSLNLLDKFENRKSRSSLNLLSTRRNSSGDPLNKLKKRNSSADLNMLTVRATESRMSLGDELDEPGNQARGPEPGGDTTPTRRSIDGHSAMYHEDAEEKVGEEDEEEQYFGPPTTLLAELQMRKQQQKSRNLTAATAFPNGMHATLLELDAVAEIEKKKRNGVKVNLAWEATPLAGPDDDASDDDVPLGVLFPGRDGLLNKSRGPTGHQHVTDWDRPLGLIAQRALEDTEPLSRRRDRLGGEPIRRRTQLLSPSQHNLAIPTSGSPQPESEEEGEGETLAQRIRRLKDRRALDNALGDDVRQSVISGDFAAELMGQFGVSEEEKSKPAPSPSPGVDEEETLGQRRARLQAEAQARNDIGTRPPNSVSAHPIDGTNSAHTVSNESFIASLPQGSLLHQDAIKQSRREATKADINRRISSFGGLNQPLLGNNVGRGTPEPAVAAKIQAYRHTLAGAPQSAPLASQSYMFTPMGGMAPAMSSMINLNGQRDSYFPQMAAPLGMNGMPLPPKGGFVYPSANMMQQPQQMMPMNMMGMPMNGMQGGMHMGMNNPYQQMGGMRQSSMINLHMNAMQMQQMQHPQMMMDAPLIDPRQRDMIDQWRNGVA